LRAGCGDVVLDARRSGCTRRLALEVARLTLFVAIRNSECRALTDIGQALAFPSSKLVRFRYAVEPERVDEKGVNNA
jgi:hypothetical protein